MKDGELLFTILDMQSVGIGEKDKLIAILESGEKVYHRLNGEEHVYPKLFEKRVGEIAAKLLFDVPIEGRAVYQSSLITPHQIRIMEKMKNVLRRDAFHLFT